MTTKKLILAQTSEELKFIINKYKNNKNLFCVPLDLETQLYCLDKNINFLILSIISDLAFIETH